MLTTDLGLTGVNNFTFFLFFSSGAKPTLSLGIAHNYGTVWEISWCPSGTWEHESSKQCKVNEILFR